MAVNVKKVTEESVKFSYPGEEILNSLNTNTVSKLFFELEEYRPLLKKIHLVWLKTD